MDLGALFNPQGAGGPGQDTWDSMFADPRAQGALLSIAGALAQPPQFGQTGFGHLLGSLGAGGESVRTQEALDTKQQEADSRTGLRESQAQLAESRAAHAGDSANMAALKLQLQKDVAEGRISLAEARLKLQQAENESKQALRESQINLAGTRADLAGANANTASQRLDLQRQSNEDKNQRNILGNVIRFQRMYQDHVKALQTANQRASLLGQPVQPVPTFKEWAAKSPQISSMLGLTSQDVGAADLGGDTSMPDTAAPAVDPEEGRTATGPGGKKLIKRNGQWQPL